MQVVLTYHQNKRSGSFLKNLVSAKSCLKTCVGNNFFA